MAHQKLHSGENRSKQNRRSREIEAESTAYAVCQHYGIDTSDYSFPYVAIWSKGKETSELKESLDRIRKAAFEMISDIDKTVEEISHSIEKDTEHKEIVSEPSKNYQSKDDTSADQRPSILSNLHQKQEQMKQAGYKHTGAVTENKSHEKADQGGER